ncbi:MAG TPA: hypothetical protein VFQ53_43535 [Kofleriaceae bacterium]|nr:hypothetical protein [Kofleriaceae bacterium]
MHAKKLWLLALLAGCPDRTIQAVPPSQGKVETRELDAERRGVDILFVIDDSPSMEDEQASLRANFSRLVNVLETLEGGLPDVQIGVVTPNLGTSATDGTTAAPIGTCSGRGLDGALRAVPGGGPTFLRDVDDGAGGRQRNYTGTLTDAFSQLADVGINGCGIEQHLEAAKRALDGNPANAGFLRPDAYLAVIVIADEDDCSLASSKLFEGTQDATYGERINFRCTSQGVACDSPSTPFDAADGVREDCHPRFEPTQVEQVDRYVDFLKTLKSDERDIVVAGIVGNPDPFEIVTSPGGNPVLKSSCPQAAQVAFPAVRTNDFLSRFTNRVRTSICDGDLSTGLTEIGKLIKDQGGSGCFDSNLLDVDPETDGAQYDCSVVEVRRVEGEPDQEIAVLPSCDKGRFPCWKIVDDPTHCYYTSADPHLAIVIDRNGVPPDAGTRVKASCVTTVSASSGPTL